MARLALERALPATWVDEVFEVHRNRQYPRELMFSTIVELMTLVTLGLRPSLHAAARKMGNLPVSMAALYDKLNRTEPAILRGLVRGSAQRLAQVAVHLDERTSLPGWQLRIVDGNHLPASEKRLGPLRGHRGAALPGHSLVVYDPDLGLVCDVVACEDAYESERAGMQPLLDSAQAGQSWIADRHFCTHTIMQGWSRAGAEFIVREHARHPRLSRHGCWSGYERIDTGRVREQAIEVRVVHDDECQARPPSWRRIEIELDTPTEAGETVIGLWSNLPAQVDAATIAALYRKRWRIESMFQRLESVLHSEIKSLGHPRAALLGFTVAVLAYNVVSLLQRAVEQAHHESAPQLEVSSYHLAEHIKSGYEGMLIALPAEHWPSAAEASAQSLAQRLLHLARRISPTQVATSKRGPKIDKPKGYVDGRIARAHVCTARVLKKARAERP
ncbi:IS4-like element ISRso13 family transposase [Ralstonia pseudosolanacearum]|uniref:IS4-like element ISRso13 family transposase n=1 Tax=Ralstonia pseudosolanacearum TaxID=1310165 RepID=UPI0018D133C3|nr:IS4-like element ISRso13 family transposase [Ralstonia pseudosolanacearum]